MVWDGLKKRALFIVMSNETTITWKKDLKWYDPIDLQNLMCCFDSLELMIKYRMLCWLLSLNLGQYWSMVLGVALWCYLVDLWNCRVVGSLSVLRGVSHELSLNKTWPHLLLQKAFPQQAQPLWLEVKIFTLENIWHKKIEYFSFETIFFQ